MLLTFAIYIYLNVANVPPLPFGAPELEILDGLKLPIPIRSELLCAPEIEPALETSEHDDVTEREVSLLVGSEHSSSVNSD